MKFGKLWVLLMLAAGAAQAQLQTVTYTDGAQTLNGQSGRPARPGTHPGVLILPAWMGIDAHSKKVAAQLSAAGYYTFIADIYGTGHYPASTREAGERSGYFKTHISEYHRRIQRALDQLVQAGADPDRIVVVGYCFGGLGAIEAARTRMKVRGVVSFHGSYGRDTARPVLPISARVLILHGADDPYSSTADINALQDELRKAGADWQMVSYGHAVHAFTEPSAGNDNSKGAAYNEAADKRSWLALQQFLAELL